MLVNYVIVDLDNASPENKAYSDNFLDVLNQIQLQENSSS